MTRTKNRKGKNRKRTNWEISGTLQGPASKEMKLEDNPDNLISSNTKGFLLTYQGKNRETIVSCTLQLLNEYADKLYRSDDKSCCFKIRQRVICRSTAVFIESDINDPYLLVDTVFTDLLATEKSIDAENFRSLLQLLPVETTCISNKHEEILQSVKAIVEPVVVEQLNNRNLLFKMWLEGPCKSQSDKFLSYVETLNMAKQKVEHRSASELVISIQSFRNEGESGNNSTCFISLLRNFNKYQGYSIRDIISNDRGEAYASPTSRMCLKTPILPNTRGFLLSFRAGGKYSNILSTLTRLLNEHADKIYQTNERPCYFENKLLKNEGQSPIFIESDVDDPSVLVDAIYTDFIATTTIGIDVECWLRFVPVNLTCNAECEEIISRTKTILELFFSNQESSISGPSETRKEKVKTFNVSCFKKCFGESDAEEIVKGVTEYLAALGLQKIVLDTRPDLSISLRRFRNVCCISLLPTLSKFKGYSILQIVEGKDHVNIETDSIEVQDSLTSDGQIANTGMRRKDCVKIEADSNEIQDYVTSDGQVANTDTRRKDSAKIEADSTEVQDSVNSDGQIANTGSQLG